ncbi:hypothetical protein B0H34DRAFT_859427 [Crassisporium funariophilum]|nr:hypothetical protein B0H34DRAFT_859427 [Crassisporium funariophilum]
MPGNQQQHRPTTSSGEEFNFGPENSNSNVSNTEHVPTPTKDAWQAVVLGPNATRRQYEEALKEANLKVEAQRLEIRQLRMANAALRREIPKAGKGRSQKNPPPPTVTKNDERIALHGHKFGLMNELFVAKAAFLVAESGLNPMDNTRYTSPALILQGVIAKLFEEAIYLHSCNEQFRPIGPQSLIQYKKIFQQLKEIIICNSENAVYQRLFQWYNDLVFHWSSTDLTRNEPKDTDSGVEEAILGLQGIQLDNEDNDMDDGGFFKAPWIPDPVELPAHRPTVPLAEDIPAFTINNVIQAPVSPPLPVKAVTHILPTNSDVIEPMVEKAAPKARACGKQPARQPAVVDAPAPAPKTRRATRSKVT